jgi:hypothetical protein
MGRRNLAVFLGAGLGLAACDRMHVAAGVLTQRGRGWWTPLTFGTGGVVIAQVGRRFLRRGEDRDIAPQIPPFVAAYAATALLADRPRALAAGLWLTALPRVRGDLPFALLLATAGPAVEVGLSATGAFAYARPLREVVPWLSGLYLHGAPLALAVSSTREATPA